MFKYYLYEWKSVIIKSILKYTLYDKSFCIVFCYYCNICLYFILLISIKQYESKVLNYLFGEKNFSFCLWYKIKNTENGSFSNEKNTTDNRVTSLSIFLLTTLLQF